MSYYIKEISQYSDSYLRLILFCMGVLFALLILVNNSGIDSLIAQATTNNELQVLVKDVIKDLQADDAESASIHLRLVQQELSQTTENTSSTELATILINDTFEDLKNADIGSALLHMNLTGQLLAIDLSSRAPSIETTVNKTILTPATTKFLIYENNVFGGNTYNPNIRIKIMYPSDWKVMDEASNSIEITPISEIDSTSFYTTAPGAGVSLSVYTTSHKNLTQYINYGTPALNSTINYSKDFSFGDGTQAAILAFQSDTEMRPDSKTTTIYALKSGTLYEATYSAHSGLYNDYLPAAKKIIESLSISSLSWGPDILGEMLTVMDDQKDLTET